MEYGHGLSEAFSVYLLAIASLMAGVLWRFLPARRAAWWSIGLALWLGYEALMTVSGITEDHSRFPPGIAFLLLPALGLALVVALLPPGRSLALAVPAWLLMGLELFRVGVELTLAALHEAGLAPHIMTLAGGNIEILFAATAPLAAWAAYRLPGARAWLIGWNAVGLLSLANVASRAVLTTPGPLRLLPSEVPDLAILTAPFTLIPGFMAPLAIFLHVVAIRALLLRSSPAGTAAR